MISRTVDDSRTSITSVSRWMTTMVSVMRHLSPHADRAAQGPLDDAAGAHELEVEQARGPGEGGGGCGRNVERDLAGGAAQRDAAVLGGQLEQDLRGLHGGAP